LFAASDLGGSSSIVFGVGQFSTAPYIDSEPLLEFAFEGFPAVMVGQLAA
jgi:hypothetical protein